MAQHELQKQTPEPKVARDGAVSAQRIANRRARSGRRRRSAALISLAVIVALLVGGVVWYRPWAMIGGGIANPGGGAGPAEDPGKTVNILVMGVDARPGDRGRSDTMVLVNLDPVTKKVNLLSIPRDTLANLPGRGDDKINAAYAYGGIDLAKKAVAELVGMPVQYGVVINLGGSASIIDLVGGVTIDVEQKMVYSDPTQNLYIKLDKGIQHLDGRHALWYMRWRSDGRGDLGRIERQQKLFQALAEQVLTPAILPRLPALVMQVNRIVTTDIPLNDQIKMAMAGYTAISGGVPAIATVPGTAKMISGISYYVPDLNGLRELVKDWSMPAS